MLDVQQVSSKCQRIVCDDTLHISYAKNILKHDLSVAGFPVLGFNASITKDGDSDYRFGELCVYWDPTEGGNAVDDAVAEFNNGEFTDILKELVREAGFSEHAANDISICDEGLQCIGKAAYRADKLHCEILRALDLL